MQSFATKVNSLQTLTIVSKLSISDVCKGPGYAFEQDDLRGCQTTSCDIWDKVFKNGPSKICGRQPLKNVTWSILEYFNSYDVSKANNHGGGNNNID